MIPRNHFALKPTRSFDKLISRQPPEFYELPGAGKQIWPCTDIELLKAKSAR